MDCHAAHLVLATPPEIGDHYAPNYNESLAETVPHGEKALKFEDWYRLKYGQVITLAPKAARGFESHRSCAPRGSRVISSGWEIRERQLAFTSMVLAPIRLAMKRSRSGLIVRSSVEAE
jgi:hypothetical protein